MKNNENNFYAEKKVLEEFIKKYERAIISKSKDIRLTLEEASLLISSITKLFLTSEINKNNSEKSSEKIVEKEKTKNKEEIISINLDFGYFTKNFK